MTEPTPPVFTLSWLAPDSVKAWLRLTDGDDDDLIYEICADVEAYVQQCRPELWTDHDAIEVTLDGYQLTADVTGAPPNTGYRLSAGNGQNGTSTTDVNGTAHLSYTYPQPGEFTVTVVRMDTGSVVAAGDVTVPGNQSWSTGTAIRTYAPDAQVYRGAVMLAGREYRRRLSPAGIEAFGEAGTSFVARFDPDIQRLLQTGAYAPPTIA